jgi:hypothetical protein
MARKFRQPFDHGLNIPNDHPKMVEAIQKILAAGYPVRRPGRYHLQIWPVNYFPTTGVVQIHGLPKQKETGLHELFRVLARCK